MKQMLTHRRVQMKRLISLAFSAVLTAGAYADEYNPVQIIATVPHPDVGMIQYKTTKPINGSSCVNDTRIDQFGQERGLAAVWLSEPCRSCDNLPKNTNDRLMYKKVLVDLINSAAVNGTYVRLIVDGCTPKGRANIVSVVAH